MKVAIRPLLVAAVLAAAEISSFAQIGVHAGVSFPYHNVLRLDQLALTERYGLVAFLGADYDIHITDRFSFSPGLFYDFTIVMKAGKSDGHLLSDRQLDHMIDIPAHFKYEFCLKPDRLAIYLYGGPVLSVGIASTKEDELRIGGRSYDVDIVYDNYSGELRDIQSYWWYDLSQEDIRQMSEALQEQLDNSYVSLNRLDLQFDCGFGFRFRNHWELNAGYSFGVVNRYKSYYTNSIFRTSQFYVGFGYRF